MSCPLSRRTFITSLGCAPVLLSPYGSSALAAAGPDPLQPIPQPASQTDAAFIARAFEMKQRGVEAGDRAYGAVVVQEGKIIGQSASRVSRDHDATAHAELTAISQACRRMKDSRLQGATLYSSSPPCPMCEAAAYWAGIARLVYGQDAHDAGAPALCG